METFARALIWRIGKFPIQLPNLQFVKIIVLNKRTSDVQVITCARAKIYFCHDSRSLRIVTVEYLQQEERITRKMYSLHRYFKQSSVVPSSTSTYSFLSKKDIESANDSVGTAFAKKPATTSRVGLKYNTYVNVAVFAKFIFANNIFRSIRQI